MFTPLRRVFLLALGTAVACAPSPGAAADEAPYPHAVTFTAFPELRPRDLSAPAARVLALPDLPADAPPIRKVRRAQAEAGLLYLEQIVEVIRCGAWRSSLLPDALAMGDEAYRAAAEAEDSPADRLRWYEERVGLAKSLERLTEERVQVGTESPEQWHFVRFYRYAAEADLLRLQEEVVKGGAAKPRPLASVEVGAFLRDTKTRTYTAFPGVKPPAVKRLTDPYPFENKPGDDPWAGLPELEANASPLRKIQFARAGVGLAYQFRSLETVRGTWAEPPNATSLKHHLVLASLAIADLEELANRVTLFERAVSIAKHNERAAQVHLELGTYTRQTLDFYAFNRLQAEADLLRLKEEIARSGAKPTAHGKRKPLFTEWKELFQRGIPDTAFPELTPAFEVQEANAPNGEPGRKYVDQSGRLPPPATRTAESPLQRVLREQAREGLAYIGEIKHLIGLGKWRSEYLTGYLRMLVGAFNVAAELEDAPDKRLPWYEGRVRELKGLEQVLDSRVKIGTTSIQDRDLCSFVRLGAEADLFKLKADVVREKGK